MKLLSFPSLVESPFIIVKIGDYTFGNYTKTGNNLSSRVTYPNFMQSIEIVKVNGAINTYTLKMVYGITKGDDPNLLEKVFGSISKTRKISLSYGDWASPNYIYREEEAIITKISSSMDVSGSKINYTIQCTSTSLALKAQKFNFVGYESAKASDIIVQLLKNAVYGLSEIFYGMADYRKIEQLGLIARDDKPIRLESKSNISVHDYVNYLVNSMSSYTNEPNSIFKDSQYFLTVNDDVRGELGGPYFKVTKAESNVSNLNSLDTFEVDIGYPNDNFVTSFNVTTDDSWSILYDYSQAVKQPEYVYKINDKGELTSYYSPSITTSSDLKYTTETNKTWWTKMTQFPITATMTIKGLIRPAILMNYVKVNVYFYGAKHISSGLYIITRQQDTLDSSGYKTTLNLTRIGGDE